MGKGVIGKFIHDLDTPCLLVDIEVVEANIARVQKGAEAVGLGLRPHIKAHKTQQMALLQIRAGALGITSAKISEAEVFAAAGLEDIFIANQIVGAQKMARLAALARQVPKLSVAVDSLEGAQGLSEGLVKAGAEVGAILELDAGAGRCGVPAAGLRELAEQVAALPGLRVRGLFAYAGGAYALRGAEAFRDFAAEESACLGGEAEKLRAAGFDMEVVSGGCTPTAGHYAPGGGLSEIRPGTYILNDRNQLDLGACTEDQIAATVLTTVVSLPAEDRTICDAGTKALATQVGEVSAGMGWVWGHPEGVFFRLNDEHGYLDPRPLAEKPRLGDKLRVIPPRICTCLNLWDEMIVIEKEKVVDVWRIEARGKVW